MLAVLKEDKSPGVVIKDIPVPKPQDGEVLVKVKAASICGTDISIYDWTPWVADKLNPPIVIGHEVVGEIIEINGDNPRGLKKGDLVSSETHIFCGQCDQCMKGNEHICENVRFFGYQRNGGFAEYATIPIKTTWKNDQSLPIEIMSIQEPFGNAVHAADKADVGGKVVLVIGLGPVGLCEIAAAKAFGAIKVIGIDPVDYRRKLAVEMGIDEVYAELPEKYHGKMDVVMEMSGHELGVKAAFDAARIAGTLIAFGIPKKEIPIDIGKYFIDKELTVMGIFGRKIWDTWEKVSELLVSKKVDLSKLITHEFKLSEFEEAMKVMKSGESGKIILIP